MGLHEPSELRDTLDPVLALLGDDVEALPADGAVVRGRDAVAVGVPEVGPAAGHARAEVRARRPQDDRDAAGHVLAGVRPGALDDGLGPAVADAEADARPADEMEPPAGRAVEAGVAGDRQAGRPVEQLGLGPHDDDAAREALADVVVGLADELEGDGWHRERAERLARRALEAPVHLAADEPALDDAREMGAERALGRRHGHRRAAVPGVDAAFGDLDVADAAVALDGRHVQVARGEARLDG